MNSNHKISRISKSPFGGFRGLLWGGLGGLLFLSACKSQDSIYEEYIVPNGLVYPVPAMNPVAISGNNRIVISWQNNPDPKVVEARIFWNNYTDSIEVSLTPDMNVVSQFIDPIAENTYSFMIHTYDVDGNISIPVEVSGRVYGEKYQKSLINRIVSSISFISGVKIVNFSSNVSSNAVFTEILYINSDDNSKTLLQIPPTEQQIAIPNLKAGTKLECRTAYVPDMCVDTFYTDYEEFEVGTNFWLSKSDITIEQYSSQHDDGTNWVYHAIDGNYDNRWHTLAPGTYPHWIIFDLGTEVSVSQFGIWASIIDNPSSFDDRLPVQFELYIRTDKPANPDNSSGWTSIGNFDYIYLKRVEIFMIDTPVKGRYLKFVGIKGNPNSVNGSDNMVIGEFDICVE